MCFTDILSCLSVLDTFPWCVQCDALSSTSCINGLSVSPPSWRYRQFPVAHNTDLSG